MKPQELAKKLDKAADRAEASDVGKQAAELLTPFVVRRARRLSGELQESVHPLNEMVVADAAHAQFQLNDFLNEGLLDAGSALDRLMVDEAELIRDEVIR